MAKGGIFTALRLGVADYVRETDKLLLILCIISSTFGCAMIYSAMHYTSTIRTALTQFFAMILGIILAVVISLVDYEKLSRHPIIYIILGAGLLAFTYFFGYAPEGTENKAWISLPLFNMSLQPSELIKLFMIMTFSRHAGNMPREKLVRPSATLLLIAHAAVAPALVMILQKDLGTVIIMLFIAAAMLFAAGIKARWFAAGAGIIAAVSPLLWYFFFSEYQRQRFLILLDLESDAKGLGYQQLQGLNAIGAGGIFGEGFLRGTYIQSNSVPKAYNDFIFAAVGNELGLVGCLVAVGLIIAIMVRIMMVGATARDTQGKIICFGVFALIGSQLIVNVGMVLALLPVIGVTLPFFSAGGSSLIVLFAGIGLVLNVHKNRNRRQMSLRDEG